MSEPLQPGLTFIKVGIVIRDYVIVIVKIYKAVIVSTKLIILVITVIYQDYIILHAMTQQDIACHSTAQQNKRKIKQIYAAATLLAKNSTYRG